MLLGINFIKMLNQNNIKIKKNIYLLIPPILITIILYYFDSINNHGDHIFFKELYETYNNSSFQQVFHHYFNRAKDAKPIINYSSSEDFFKLIFFVLSKLNINYKYLITLSHFLLFFSFYLFLNHAKINKLLIIIIFITNFYLTSIGLGSIKNCLALSLFFFSVIYFKKSNDYLYLFFYVLSILISVYISILYLFLAILFFNWTKIFLKNNSFLKILILIAPIILQYNLIFGKFGGYNSHEFFKKENIEKKIIENEKKNNLYNSIEDKIISNSINDFDIFLNFIKQKKTIEVFTISLRFVPDRFGKIENKKVFINYSLINLIKYFIINSILFLFVGSKNLILFFTFFLISLLIYLFINFERMTMIGFIIFISSLVFTERNIIKNSLHYYLILLICLYGFLKTTLLIFNLFFYNEIY